MIIVSGYLTVNPTERASYLDGCVEVVRLARAADGCHDFALGADLSDPTRVNVYERWASQAQLHAFRGSGPDDGQQAAILGADVREYTVNELQS
ncbi:antibiotic biosynthesis monooxygenase family protein [Rhodococcus sp. G-MC3]|uniref:putative quinol monooxygenase n=1 Tax=Rhodococcus sp. G-MC3 TaxID=3046209 RepID=UPI0024BBCA9C|nr:antibiotic biosynthesis monooxygenase family protein [Rhodococcus sp. G-MC3]MDJ0394813.1 antibiotic biosynthesis monooxygenase family protein [Rhodococcus sp. G-MC3]